MKPLKSEDVTRVSKDLGIGLLEAKQVLIRYQTLSAIDSAKTIDDLKPILKQIVSTWNG